jgi:hypothetical protein
MAGSSSSSGGGNGNDNDKEPSGLILLHSEEAVEKSQVLAFGDHLGRRWQR